MKTIALLCLVALSTVAALPARAQDADVVAAKDDRRPPPPDKKKRLVVVEHANPAAIGLGAAGGAFAGTLIGAAGTSAAGFFVIGLAGPQPPAVLVSAAVLGLGMALATPFLAALGGGALVILLDPRSNNDEWIGLLQCAAAGYCAGLSLVAGTVLGGGLFCTPGAGNIPGPDRPAEWTGGSAIFGLFAGTVAGGLLGWVVAPDPSNPLVPIAAGAVGGALIGSSSAAGVGAAIATALRP